MSSPFAAVCLVSVLLLGQGEKPDKAPTPEQIKQAVAQLGDDDFTVRQEATRLLWKAGRAAEDAVREALKSDDAEVVSRARFILEKFKYGIFPDTPAKVIEQIDQFRRGDPNAKLKALIALKDMGTIRTISRLIATESNEATRNQWLNVIARDTSKVVPALLAEGDFGEAEKWLELGASSNSTGMRNLAVFLLLQGKLEGRIAELKAEVQGGHNSQTATQLAYLLRAAGDLPAAVKVAEDTGQRLVRESLLEEHGDWKLLAALRASDPNYRKSIEPLGYVAAYHRLAGNTKEFQDTIAAINRFAADNPGEGWYSFEALAINGQFAAGLRVLEKQSPASAFKILLRQRRYRQALKLVGIDKPRGPYGDWFRDTKPGDEAAKPGGKVSAEFRNRFTLGIDVARAAYRLGEKRSAEDLFAQLGKAGEAQQPDLLFSLADAQRDLGLTDAAFAHGMTAFEKSPNEGGVRRMFPNHANAANAWWKALDQAAPKDSLRRMHELLVPGEKKKSAEELARSLEEADKQFRTKAAAPASNLGVNEIVDWLHALGETALIHGHDKLAGEYFTKAVDFSESAPASGVDRFPTTTALRLGDLRAQRQQWTEAAAWYRRAWERNNKRHNVALYLMGHALEKSGRAEEGRRHMKLAGLLPLADDKERHGLAADLKKRGMLSEAVAQWNLILRVGGFDSWYVNDSHKELGNSTSGKDDVAAADHWDRFMRSVLRTSSAFIESTAYVTMPHLIHRIRARGYLTDGKVDEAIKEIELAQAALPADTNLAIDLVPLLEKAGRRKEADKLFAEVYAANRQVIDDFPDAALYLNNTAWLAGRLGRKLDEALEFSSKAVKLAPEKAGYLDTLAEVHFRRGDPAEAIRLMKKCIAMEPENKFFQEQLIRFQGSDDTE